MATSAMYTVNEIPGANSYTWLLPEGASGSGNGNIIEVLFSPDAVSGYIRVSGQNDCGTGPAAEFFTTVNPTPDQPQVSVTGIALMSDAITGNQWYSSVGPIEGATGQYFEATATDYYHTMVTVSGCSSAPSVPVYVVVTNTPVYDIPTDLYVYPNPAANLLYIKSELKINTAQVEILDIYGTKQHVIYMDNTSTIDISRLKPGIYLLQVGDGRNNAIRRFVKF
jgi:hypothetical protein